MSERLHPTSDEEFAALKARVARLERLEEQVYFQEQTLSELNDVITLQQKQLDHYQARLETLEEGGVFLELGGQLLDLGLDVDAHRVASFLR